MRLYQKSAALGDALAMNNIGSMYHSRLGVDAGHKVALDWFQKAAALANAQALNTVGEAYCIGHGVPVDFLAAITWYKKAAELNHPFALNSLAYCYENGKGVQPSLGRAIAYYHQGGTRGQRRTQTTWRRFLSESTKSRSSREGWLHIATTLEQHVRQLLPK